MNSQELKGIGDKSKQDAISALDSPEDDLKTPTVEELSFPGQKVRRMDWSLEH